MRTDATPFIVGQIRRVSFALHSAERRPPEHPLSTFQTVSRGVLLGNSEGYKGRKGPGCREPRQKGKLDLDLAPLSVGERGAGVSRFSGPLPPALLTNAFANPLEVCAAGAIIMTPRL